MLEKKQTIFIDGANQDADEQFTQSQGWRWASGKKFLYSDTDQVFTCEDDMGNVLRSNPLATGSYVIGSVEHPTQSRLYYALYEGSLGTEKHSIWVYDATTKAHTLLYEGVLLNFQSFTQSLDMNIVNGVLYWTTGKFNDYFLGNNGQPKFNPPRKFNISMMELYQAGSPSGYPSVDYQTLDVIKWPPRNPPVVAYRTEPTRKTNLVWGKLWQFSARYIYDDDEISVPSFISKIPMPTYHETMAGRVPFGGSQDNVINVKVNSGHHTVKRVEIMARKGNNGAFLIFKTIDKDLESIADDTTLVVPFYGNEGGRHLPNEELLDYHRVPISARNQAIVENNTLVYANVYEGFDRVAIDVDLTHKVHKLPNYAVGVGYGYVCTMNGNNCRVLLQDAHLLNPGDVLRFKMLDDTTTCDGNYVDAVAVTYEWTVQEGDITGASQYAKSTAAADALVAWFGVEYPSLTVTKITSSPFDLIEINCHKYGAGANSSVVHIAHLRKFRSFKSGAEAPLGLMYYDRANRNGTVYENDDETKIYIPFFPEVDFAAFGIDDTYRIMNRIDWKINHTPPDWATHYQWVFQGNSRVADFQQRTVVRVAAYTGDRLKLSLDPYYVVNYEGAVFHHEIQKGDTVRLIEKVLNDDADVDQPTSYVEEVVELTVLEYDPTGGASGSESVVVEYFQFQGFVETEGNNQTDRGFLIEIHTPRAQLEERPYFELGEVMTILDPHDSTRRHGGRHYEDVAIVSATTSPSTVIVEGDFSYLEAGGIMIITNSSVGNDGTYTVSTSTYSIDDHQTTIVLSTALTAGESVGTFALAEIYQDQILGGIGAGGQLSDGDVYVRQRMMATTFFSGRQTWGWWIEDFHYSDYLDSNDYDKGKIAVVDPNHEHQHLSQTLRSSQAWLENSNRNGMSEFLFSDVEQLESEHGEIHGIFKRGHTLICVQESKVTAIDIFRSVFENPDGQSSVVATNKALGSKRPRNESYGCLFPMAIVQAGEGGDVYYWDLRKKKIIKDTSGGVVVVSDIGMQSEWRQVSQELIDGNFAQWRILAGYDPDTREVLFTWRYALEFVASFFSHGTYAFNTLHQKWTGSYPYYPNHYAKFNDRFITFDEWELYEHNDDTGVPGTYYGTANDRWVEFNVPAGFMATFQSILIDCNVKPSAVKFDIRSDEYNGSGMTSDLSPQHLREREGNYFSAILRDRNTPNAVNTNVALLNGREMRGKSIRVRITHDSTTISSIRSVVLQMLVSEYY